MIRDPRWGRNIETPGGDPYLTGQYAINFVKGMERNPEDPRYSKNYYPHYEIQYCFVEFKLPLGNLLLIHAFLV